MDVFVNYEIKFIFYSYVFSVIILNFLICKNVILNFFDNFNCFLDFYIFLFLSCIFGYIGIYFFGIWYIKKNIKVSNIDVRWKRWFCGLYYGCGKRFCVDVKDVFIIFLLILMIIIFIYNFFIDVNYLLSILVSGCFYWFELKEKWISEGCWVRWYLFYLFLFLRML